MTPLHRLVLLIPPASGAVVMGTAIVSIDLRLASHELPSLVPLAVAIATWLFLGAILAGRAVIDRRRFAKEARVPAALTGIAGTSVLGTRLTLLGWQWAGIALLLIAVLLWMVLVPRVLRHWHTPTVGSSFVLTVSTESLAVLAATLASSTGAAWLAVAATVPLALGVGFYGFVLSRFDLRQVLVGRGDHWVVGGALAISALACGRVTEAAGSLGVLGGGHDALEVATLGIWAAAMVWLPILVVTELLRPRFAYDVRRWSTLFPVGMYAACSFLAGTVRRLSYLVQFASVWTDVAVAVWVIVLAAMLWQGVRVFRAPAASLPHSDTESVPALGT